MGEARRRKLLGLPPRGKMSNHREKVTRKQKPVTLDLPIKVEVLRAADKIREARKNDKRKSIS